jgi:hypothetical protein
MALQNNSNLPTIQRIKYEDYKDAPQWFALFLVALNLFMTAVYNILNRGITYSNLGVIATFTFLFTPGATTGFKFTNPLIIPPNNVIVGNVYIPPDRTNHLTANAVQIFWHYSDGNIIVDDVAGLTTGVTYSVTVMVS